MSGLRSVNLCQTNIWWWRHTNSSGRRYLYGTIKSRSHYAPKRDGFSLTSLLVDQELIPHHYSFYRSCCWGKCLQKTWGSVVSNQIGTKFGRNVLQLNTLQLMESDFLFDVTLSRWQTWRHFTQKSAGIWRVHTPCLPGICAAAAYASSWSIAHSYLFFRINRFWKVNFWE